VILADHVPALIPSITLAMSDPKSSALKLDALVFTRMLMDGSAAAATTAASASVFQPHVPSLVPLVVGCVGEDWYSEDTHTIYHLSIYTASTY
jgi:hypothetical protein